MTSRTNWSGIKVGRASGQSNPPLQMSTTAQRYVQQPAAPIRRFAFQTPTRAAHEGPSPLVAWAADVRCRYAALGPPVVLLLAWLLPVVVLGAWLLPCWSREVMRQRVLPPPTRHDHQQRPGQHRLAPCHWPDGRPPPAGYIRPWRAWLALPTALAVVTTRRLFNFFNRCPITPHGRLS